MSDRDALRLNCFSKWRIARQLEDCQLQRRLSQKGLPMFTAEQYRARASEYAKLVGRANGPNELQEFQRLERSFTALADNAQWMTDNRGNMVQATEHVTAPLTPAAPAQGVSQQ